MFRRSVVAAALLLFACTSEPEVREKGSGAPPLWQIENARGQTEGWLFGTIHSLPQNTRWKTEQLDAVLKRSDLLVVEVANLGDDAAIGRAFADLAYDSPPPDPVRDRIDPANRARFEQLLTTAKVRRDFFDSMESWAAALALNQAAAGRRAQNGVDAALIERFEGREVLELEGPTTQLGVFDTLPEADQRDFLNAIIEEAGDGEAELARLAHIWSTGDTKALGATIDDGLLADPELYEALLANRNRLWADRLESLLTAPARPLVAVGAAHMFGPDGLPALLTERGYTVRQVQ